MRFKEMTKEEFIKEVITGLTPPSSAYFPQNVHDEIEGYELALIQYWKEA